ncbi:MAG: HAD family hydrolase [Mollicutes bacterium]|nr:HAD family hydrolase [Mollicutes bacterium]
MKKFVIFDLDGTLIDTVEGITIAANKYLSSHNIPFVYSRDDIESFIGNGAPLLFKRMMKNYKYNENDYQEFLTFYRDNQKYSKVYPEVVSSLKALISRGYSLFILSNKPDSLLQILIKELLSEINFKYIQGQDNKYPTKPDVTLLNEKIINSFDLDPNEGYYVGDSYVDVLTGQNAKLKSIFVTYGYGDYQKAMSYKPNYIIDKFEDILEIVK